MSASLALRASTSGRFVNVAREGDIPEDFWLLALAGWGTAGRRPGETLEVPTERFLGNLSWLPGACRTYGVALDWDQHTTRLVRRHQSQHALLGEALQAPATQTSRQLEERLALTRFTRDLLPFQQRDLGRLLAMANGANFSVPGAGKTVVQYALYELLRAAGEVQQLLVVAPLSAFDAWTDEAHESFSTPPVLHRYDGAQIPVGCEVLLVSYQRLWSSYEGIAVWVAGAPTAVCLDEAHRIKKGRRGEWGAVSLDLGFLAARRDVLTGTPAPQRPTDLAVLLDFLWSGRSQEVLPDSAYLARPPSDVGHQIAHAIRPLFVRTTKHELDLPKVTKLVQEVPLRDLHAEIYGALRDRYSGAFAVSRGQRRMFAQLGAVVMYLLEAATNPGLLSAGSATGDALRFRHPPLPIPAGSNLAELLAAYGAYETPEKFVVLARLVKENADAGRKTLVWSNFVRNLQALERLLEPHAPAIVHGGIPAKMTQPAAPRVREDEIERFRTDDRCHVLLANPAAIGEGISLHDACNDAIYVERTFNAGQYLQSVDRIHRLGLKPGTETRITFLQSPGTIDAVVAERVRVKAELMGTMLEDQDITLMALPDDDDVGPALDLADEQDVDALFDHLREG